LLDAFDQIAMMHAQKITKRAVSGLRRSEIRLIIFVQLAVQMHPDLVEHPREINDAFGRLSRALWKFSLAHAIVTCDA
jgi:hypothetical protein